MLLDGRNAVSYGGGGAIGGAVARAFAREGARVHLAGRTPAPLAGVAETAVVDALHEGAVDGHADAVAARHMLRQGSGVILVFGGYGPPPPGYHLGGLQVAFQAMEALRRNLASELGPHGIRTRPPEALVLQPSAAIFDITMLVTGAMILAGAWLVHRAFRRRAVTIPLACYGIGVFGIGVFRATPRRTR